MKLVWMMISDPLFRPCESNKGRSMRQFILAAYAALIGFSTTSFSETANHPTSEKIEGIVRIVGSAYNMKVSLTREVNGKKGSVIFCKNAESTRVGRLGGMTVKVEGTWKVKSKSRRCLTIASFEVMKAPSGRKPLVGLLVQNPENFAIETSDGKKHSLGSVSPGLKALVGKKVIVDAKPMMMKSGGSKNWKVVTYAAYP